MATTRRNRPAALPRTSRLARGAAARTDRERTHGDVVLGLHPGRRPAPAPGRARRRRCRAHHPRGHLHHRPPGVRALVSPRHPRAGVPPGRLRAAHRAGAGDGSRRPGPRPHQAHLRGGERPLAGDGVAQHARLPRLPRQAVSRERVPDRPRCARSRSCSASRTRTAWGWAARAAGSRPSSPTTARRRPPSSASGRVSPTTRPPSARPWTPGCTARRSAARSPSTPGTTRSSTASSATTWTRCARSSKGRSRSGSTSASTSRAGRPYAPGMPRRSPTPRRG